MRVGTIHVSYEPQDVILMGIYSMYCKYNESSIRAVMYEKIVTIITAADLCIDTNSRLAVDTRNKPNV